MVRSVGDKDVGLKVLQQPGEYDQDTIDIVAIHGIGAHPDDTWTTQITTEDGQKAYVNWLTEQQMLPAVATNARIMRYGYKSAWFGKEPMQARVTDVATRLLHSLAMKREDFPDRPLIFITHCFGGLVALKACTLARHDYDDGEWKPIFQSTIGIMTLGTPFRGADGMDQRMIVEAALREYTEDEVRGETIEILQRENQTLNDLVAEFCKIHRREGQPRMACFYETGYTNVGAIFGGDKRIVLLVSQSSGHLDLAENCPIARNHFRMNKFEDPHEEDFMFVMKALKKIMKGSTSDCVLFNACKEMLRQPEVATIDVDTDTVDTSVWLTRHDTFVAWKSPNAFAAPKSRLLTLVGNPGTGKTVLIREVAEKSREQGTIVLRYHFVRSKTGDDSVQDQVQACYRSLLFQLLDSTSVQPRRFLHDWQEETKFQKEPSPSYWNKSKLTAAIHEILFSDKCCTYRVFIDALDVCNDAEGGPFPAQPLEIFHFITETLLKSLQAGVDVRFCLSRRHYPHHGKEEPGSLKIVLEDNIQHMVEDTIKAALKTIPDRGAREYVLHRLSRHRIREFRWPRKVIKKVKAGPYKSHNAIRDIVDKEFADLERGVESPDYGHDNVIPETAALLDPQTVQLLQLVSAARFPMAADEIRHALAFSVDEGPRDIRKWETSNDAIIPGEEFEAYIRKRSCGLLEFHYALGSKTTIRFIHPAVEGLVRNRSISASVLPLDWKQQSHLSLLQLCFGALEKAVDLYVVENVTFPFLEYAFEHWLYHTKMSGDLLPSLQRLPRFLDSCIFRRTRLIVERHVHFLRACNETELAGREELGLTTLLAEADSMLVLLASHGCTAAVKYHVTRCARCKLVPQQLDEGQYRKAIDNAIIAGHPDVAKWLIERCDENDLNSHRLNRTLLFRASYRGFVDVAKSLLEKGANPTTPSYIPYEFPLHVAIEFGFEELVILLITSADEGILRVKCQRYGKTALHVALQSSHRHKIEILQALLRTTAAKFPSIGKDLVHIPNKAGKTPLQLVRDGCAINALGADRLQDEFIDYLGSADWCEKGT